MAFLKKVFVKEAGTGASPTTAPVPPLATKSVVPGPTYDEEPITLLPKECIEHLKLQKISAADAIADFDILLVCLAADFKQRPEIYKLIKKLAKDRCRAKRNSGEIAAKADPNSGVQPETPKKRLTRTNSAEPLRPSSQRAQYRSPFDDEDDEEDLPPPPPKSSRRQREIEKMKEEWRRKMRGEPTEEEKLKEEWRRKMRGEMTEEEKLKEEWRRKMRGDVADPASGASPPASNPTTPQISRVAQPAQAADGVPGSSTSATTLGVTAAAQPASAGGSAISAQSAESVTPPLGNQPSPRLVPAFTAPAAGSAPQAPASNSPTDRAAGAATPPADETPEARDKREKKEKKREKKERKRKEAEALANAPAAAPAVVAIPTVAAPSAPSAPKGSSPRSADAGKVANPAVTVAPAAATAAAATSTSPVQSNTGAAAPTAAAPAAAAAVVPVSTSLGAAAPAPVSRDKSPFGRSKDRITKPPVEQLLEIAKQDDPGKFYGDRTRIGKGGFGDVYLASDSRQKKGSRQSQVAIKVSREKISNTFHAELIANEIILLSQCRHKNIVNYLECYLFRERIWMVMEYCDGGTLTELYKGVELNELHFSFIIKAVLLGLQYLHDQNRLHRDIKGENILLNLDGEVKIADLGLAAEAEEKGSGLVGSRYWMSPEMIRREGYDFKTDIWSTGCLVIELCNLEPPYHEYRSMKALFKIATKGAAPLKNPDSFSSPLKSFLAAATQFHPEERPSAAQLLQHPWIVKSGKKEDMMKATEVVFLGNSLRMNGF